MFPFIFSFWNFYQYKKCPIMKMRGPGGTRGEEENESIRKIESTAGGYVQI